MKKILAILLMFTLVFALAACDSTTAPKETAESTEQETVEESAFKQLYEYIYLNGKTQVWGGKGYTAKATHETITIAAKEDKTIEIRMHTEVGGAQSVLTLAENQPEGRASYQNDYERCEGYIPLKTCTPEDMQISSFYSDADESVQDSLKGLFDANIALSLTYASRMLQEVNRLLPLRI